VANSGGDVYSIGPEETNPEAPAKYLRSSWVGHLTSCGLMPNDKAVGIRSFIKAL
jgi:hypothetical protein